MRGLFCVLLTCAIGCSSSSGTAAPKLYPVTGTLKVDGAPLPDTTVMLYPVSMESGAQPALGRTDSEGNFKIATNGNRGATEGQFKVVLVPEGESPLPETTSSDENPNESSVNAYIASMQTKTKAKPVLKFPKDWANAKTSPKTFEVKPEPNVLDIDI